MRHRIPLALLTLLVVGLAGSRANPPPPPPFSHLDELPQPPLRPQPQPLPRQPIVAPLILVVSSGKNPATRLRLANSALKELRAELPRDNGRRYAGGWTTSS